MRVSNLDQFVHKCTSKHFNITSVKKNGKTYTIKAEKHDYQNFGVRLSDLFHPVRWFKRNFLGESTITFKATPAQMQQISDNIDQAEEKKASVYSKDKLIGNAFRNMWQGADNIAKFK